MARTNRPVVALKQGALRGVERKGVAVFKGVPFAQPPVGDLRWRPPQPPEPWSGVRDASKHGPTAMQNATGIYQFIDGLAEGQGWGRARTAAVKGAVRVAPTPKASEDCLYLTVRTPMPRLGTGLPVMVWIHGGDHHDGSGSEPFYESNSLPEQGVVTVTINYRLGLMGYFAHPDLIDESDHGVAGNYGTLDQIAALEWVRDNIEAFGGDPDNVMVFGESAGGESVVHMMTSPLARGLFHRAVSQSAANGGQMRHLTIPFADHLAATDQSERFAAVCGVTGPDQLARLRAMSAEDLYEVVRANEELGSHYPVIDGHVLPASPFECFAAGDQAPVPMLIGSNADEGSVLHPLLSAPLAGYRWADAPQDRLPEFVDAAFGDDLPALLELYPGLERRDPEAEMACLGDSMFGAAAFWYAEHHATAGHPTFLYMFERVPPSPEQTAGAFHAAEVPFVHGTNSPVLPLTKDDQALSEEMIQRWVAFATGGDPNAAGVHERWPTFDPASPLWLRFNYTVRASPIDRLPQYRIFTRRLARQVAEMQGLRVGA